MKNTIKMTKYFCNEASGRSALLLLGKSKIEDLVKDGFGALSTPFLQINNN